MSTVANEIAITAKDAEQERRDLAARWVMPEISMADDVVHYSQCNRNKEPQVGKVVEWGTRCVTIAIASPTTVSHMVDSVRHIDDPDLQLKPNLRVFGGWDYTDAHKARIAEQKKLTAVLKRLDERISALETQLRPTTMRDPS